jgi:hypothetical protein
MMTHLAVTAINPDAVDAACAAIPTDCLLGVLAIAVGLAIPGFLTPVTGALLHELSSVPVIMSSAGLIGFKERNS